jgi:hypothetical protein
MQSTKPCHRCGENVGDLRAHRKYCPNPRLFESHENSKYACEHRRGPFTVKCWGCNLQVADLKQHRLVCQKSIPRKGNAK